MALDIILADMLQSHFIPLRKEVEKLTNGINMIQKARLANILGLIDKTVFNDLKQIHEIRNKFGHSFEASFANTEVLTFVKNLSTAKGKEVTTENSYKFYKSAVLECVVHLIEYLTEKNPEG
ncbi:MAG: hypothetical protein A2Z38_11385 [Planctomycetes bacterium RBG_19FT_COMBO_48_8]|nr:MAG: hypothetical protein A2Z38_11385 [Planctomycetes bacterium RBG_19FT_COMBO_48_8]